MKRQTVFFLIAVLAVIPCGAQRKATKDIEVSVAQYRYDCDCAVSQTFDNGIQEDLPEKKDSVWTATFADVAMYMTERDSVRLAVKHERNIVRVTPSLSLDRRIYTMPLTLNLRSTKPIIATQDGKSLPILRNGEKTFLEFNPFGGEIVITQLENCKRISILGDSYSTIYGWITPGNESFYPHGDVVDAGQTWWQQVVSSGGYVLECNNSYSGSTMTNNTLPNWRDRSHKMEVSTSFISRCTNLGNPDIILICGGTNDEWNNDKSMGEFKYGNWKENDLKLFRPGTAYLLNLVKTTYPNAKVYFVLNDILERVGESIKTICDHYDIPVIAPQGIEKDETGHPTQAGMTTIADAVKQELQIKK